MHKTFHKLENVMRDVYVNNRWVDAENLPILKDALRSNYTDNFFKEKDFLNHPIYDENWNIVDKKPLPKHLQFLYKILREEMVPDEECIVDKKINNIIKRLKLNGSIESSVKWTFKDRLKSIWNSIEPIYEKLLDEDVEELPPVETRRGASNPWNIDETWIKPSWNVDETPKNSEWEDQKWKPSGKPWKSKDANPFEDFYKNMPDLPHVLKDALSEEDMEKLKDKIVKNKKEKMEKTKEELEIEKRVKWMWINPDDEEKFEKIKKKLNEYLGYKSELEKIKDTENWNSVMDEIADLFESIRSRRKKETYKYTWPVDLEHSTDWWLYETALAGGYSEIKAGNYNPEMFRKVHNKEIERQFVWKFDLTIIADGTGSMIWPKNTQQKKAVILVNEALKKLHDHLEEDSHDLLQTIDFEIDNYIFWSNSRKTKEKSSNLTDEQRLKLYDSLDEQDWKDNNEWLLLEKIYKEFTNLSSEYHQEIKDWKTKKIIFLMTDGKQDVDEYEAKLKENIKNFKEDWVLVYGIWIANDAEVTIYDWDDETLWCWKMCEDPSDLAKVLKDILKEHLEKL